MSKLSFALGNKLPQTYPCEIIQKGFAVLSLFYSFEINTNAKSFSRCYGCYDKAAFAYRFHIIIAFNWGTFTWTASNQEHMW